LILIGRNIISAPGGQGLPLLAPALLVSSVMRLPSGPSPAGRILRKTRWNCDRGV